MINGIYSSLGQISTSRAPVSYTHLDVYKRQAHDHSNPEHQNLRGLCPLLRKLLNGHRLKGAGQFPPHVLQYFINQNSLLLLHQFWLKSHPKAYLVCRRPMLLILLFALLLIWRRIQFL